MMRKRKLRVSIFSTTLVLFLAQVAFFSWLGRSFGFSRNLNLFFPLFSGIYHGILVLVLMLFRFAFYNLSTHEPIFSINLPTKLTMVRISSTPTIIVLLLIHQDYPILFYLFGITSLAFLTDFLDGNISRRSRQVTKIGAYLDSMSDYGMLISLSFAYLYLGLLSFSFFLLVMIRLVVQWAGMGILTIIHRGWADHRSSILGKISVFIIMTVYTLALLQLTPLVTPLGVTRWFSWVEAGAVVVIVLSLLEKLGILVVDIKNALEEKRKSVNPEEPSNCP